VLIAKYAQSVSQPLLSPLSFINYWHQVQYSLCFC